ncbi:hypothetical protein ES705_14254 [subsurface metagenome]
MFYGLDIEVLVEIERRCEAELKNKAIPHQRREEVKLCLDHIKEAKKVKKGFYVEY